MAADVAAKAVSTHSRPKAAGPKAAALLTGGHPVSTHSRPKAAGSSDWMAIRVYEVSTHSRPKAAGCTVSPSGIGKCGFNSQPPEGGWMKR